MNPGGIEKVAESTKRPVGGYIALSHLALSAKTTETQRGTEVNSLYIFVHTVVCERAHQVKAMSSSEEIKPISHCHQ